MADHLDKSPVALIQEHCGCSRLNQVKLCVHITLLTSSLSPSSFVSPLFLSSINLNSSSDWELRKNHEIFPWERKMKHTEVEALVFLFLFFFLQRRNIFLNVCLMKYIPINWEYCECHPSFIYEASTISSVREGRCKRQWLWHSYFQSISCALLRNLARLSANVELRK